jgi:hypothetical protein
LCAQQEDDFYDLSVPAFFQQGDILPDAPLISLPPSEHLVLVRDARTQSRLAEPTSSSEVRLFHEQALDAFPEDAPEHVVVSAQRGMAMIITQTCDIADHQTEGDNWSVCPCYSIEGSEVNEGMLFSDHPLKQRYPNLFGLPKHPNAYFDAHYVDLSDIRTISCKSIKLADRIASLVPLKQLRLNDKLAWMFSRAWGYSEGEDVPADGKYRCNLCNRFYGIVNPEIDLKVGMKFPACVNCTKLRKRPQWYLLHKHKPF